MRIATISVQRPVFATVVSLMLVILGLLAYTRLSVRELPEVESPVFSIETTYRGAAADVVETKITQLIEERSGAAVPPPSARIPRSGRPAGAAPDATATDGGAMTQANAEEKNLALFVDFDNIALGLKGTPNKKFEIALVLQRLLEKGKIIIKKAYADWSHYPQYKNELHAAGIEMIEIPKRHISGKNSADIRLAVDAMDLCWAKEHLDTIVIVSGDSDFSPLVAKLRENGKAVIGLGMRDSSSELLIRNSDEFIFYEDLGRESAPALDAVPQKKAEAFRLLASTVQALLREGKENLPSSVVKDTMKRKAPSFTESSFGYRSFSELLEDTQAQGIVELARNQRAGGTWLVTGVGREDAAAMGRFHVSPKSSRFMHVAA